MSQTPPSLLDYLDAPILVGDPDGCTVYVNTAFETRFGVDSDKVRGQALAELFEGDARETILRAVAEVCGGSGSARFQLRDGNRGYSVVASPISAATGSVGVIILLTEEQLPGDTCQRTVARPLRNLAGQDAVPFLDGLRLRFVLGPRRRLDQPLGRRGDYVGTINRA